MRIWLVHVGESLPIQPGKERKLRMALFADALTGIGHDVVWWASTFDHSYKKHISHTAAQIKVKDHLTIQLLHGSGYRRNVSLRRLIDHRQLAWNFKRVAPTVPPPDAIFCTIPTIELAAVATSFARKLGVPVIIDVRDLWPDIFEQVFPSPFRPVARLLLTPLRRSVKSALRNADGIVAVSPSYLQWGLRYAGRSKTDVDAVFPLGYPRLRVDPAAIREAGDQLLQSGLDPTKKIAWFVGLFGRTYDLSTVIEAARGLDQCCNAVQFVFSGTGDLEHEWRRQASGLGNVVFTGWVGAADIAYLMGIAWVGLAAYTADAPQSYPNKLFEYMSGGLPILSSLGADAAELLERHGCGLSYRAGDSQDLTEKIMRLLSSEDTWKRLSANSRAAYDQHYSAERVYGKMAAFVLRVANDASDKKTLTLQRPRDPE